MAVCLVNLLFWVSCYIYIFLENIEEEIKKRKKMFCCKIEEHNRTPHKHGYEENIIIIILINK